MAAVPFTADELADFRAVAMAFPPHPTSDVARLLATLDDVEAERDDLRAAGQAFFADIESEDGDSPERCDEEGCRQIAMRNVAWWKSCEKHAEKATMSPTPDRSYAASLRALRALLKGGA